MISDLEEVVGKFRVGGELINVRPYGNGHINDTFIVSTQVDGRLSRYVLQRINQDIFKDTKALMGNMLRVTGHIYDKVKSQFPENAEKQLRIIQTRDYNCMYNSPDGGCWRLCNFIENTVSYDAISSPELAFEAARMFGWFQKNLRDLPGGPLNETIVDFHNTPKRFQAFIEVLEKDPCNRAKDAENDIEFVLQNTSICETLLDFVDKGLIPVRATHNDTKINNVLFDEHTNNGVCVIDLDTVMPGLSLYDFGDMVRTATCNAAEDEQDLSKIQMDITLFEQLARGYAKETASLLTDTEKKYLSFAGKLITFEQLIRFLADHLAGDTYYKIHRPGHNLDRSRTQMKLVQSIIEQEEHMNKITESIWNQL